MRPGAKPQRRLYRSSRSAQNDAPDPRSICRAPAPKGRLVEWFPLQPRQEIELRSMDSRQVWRLSRYVSFLR